jgi:hypothetical protein
LRAGVGIGPEARTAGADFCDVSCGGGSCFWGLCRNARRARLSPSAFCSLPSACIQSVREEIEVKEKLERCGTSQANDI